MNFFLKRILIFIVVFAFLTLLFELVSNKIINSNADFSLRENPKYIIFGHSHSGSAFNDSLINSFINLSQGGEAYFYTYQKIKKVLEQDNTLKTVFVEFANNHVDEEMNSWIWGETHMPYRYALYSPFMSGKEKFLLFRKSPKVFLHSFSASSKDRAVQMFNDDYYYIPKIGRYKPIYASLGDSNLNSVLKIPHLDNNLNEDGGISRLSIEYLSKIIEICKKHGKRVILTRSPLHENYSGYKNEDEYKEILKNRFGSIEYLDFSKFPLTNDEFLDFEHLNYNGAKVFSSWFQEKLDGGLLTMNQKQDFLDKEMKILRDKNP